MGEEHVEAGAAAGAAGPTGWFVSADGLPRNRGDEPVAAVHPGGDETSVLFIDLDDFKTVNDGLGHDAGDQLLVRVSERLVRCVGPTDLVARLGGDEFGVLVAASPDGPAAGSNVAQRIINAMKDPFDVGGNEIRVSASIGIATCAAGAADADSVLVQADIAMYHAKANGKNQFAYFTEEMHQSGPVRAHHFLGGAGLGVVAAGSGSDARPGVGDGAPDTAAAMAETIASAARCRPDGHPTSGAGRHDDDAPAGPTRTSRSRRSA